MSPDKTANGAPHLNHLSHLRLIGRSRFRRAYRQACALQLVMSASGRSWRRSLGASALLDQFTDVGVFDEDETGDCCLVSVGQRLDAVRAASMVVTSKRWPRSSLSRPSSSVPPETSARAEARLSASTPRTAWAATPSSAVQSAQAVARAGHAVRRAGPRPPRRIRDPHLAGMTSEKVLVLQALLN